MSLSPDQAEAFWSIADKDNDGALTVQELKQALAHYGAANLSDKDIASMLCDIDKDGDNRISKQEFLDEMIKKPKRSKTLEDLFKQYDTSGDGFLSRDEITALICNCGQFKNPKAVAKQIIEQCDQNGDGKISFNEFKAAV